MENFDALINTTKHELAKVIKTDTHECIMNKKEVMRSMLPSLEIDNVNLYLTENRHLNFS